MKAWIKILMFGLCLIFPIKAYSTCPIDLDLYHIHNSSYRINRFDIGMEILNHYLPHLNPSNVIVGVYDVGFYRSPQINGEFLRGDDEYTCEMPLPDLDSAELSAYELSRYSSCQHGIFTTSIISGINGDMDQSISGYLSLFQRTDPPIIRVVYIHRDHRRSEGYINGPLVSATIAVFRNSLEYMQRLIERGATIINCSVNWTFRSTDEEGIADAHRLWIRFIREHSNVLFLVSSGNENREPYPEEIPVAFGGQSNVLIVGSVMENEDGEIIRRPRSNYGPQVEIHAPGHQIPVAFNNTFRLENGTSLSTPMVTSLAAIIKSLKPSLNAAQIKQFILTHADRTNPAVPHIDFAKVIMEILRTTPGLPLKHRDLLNPSRSDMNIYASDMLYRICGRSSITRPVGVILEHGTFPFSSIAVHSRHGRIGLGSHTTPHAWNSQTYNSTGPGYNVEFQVSDNPLNTVAFSYGGRNYISYSTQSRLSLPVRPCINYMSVNGEMTFDRCTYFKERGRSFNAVVGRFANYRRLLFYDGSISANLVSCRLANPGRVGMPSPYGIPLMPASCRELPEYGGGPGTPLSEAVNLSFTDFHYFIFDDSFWNQITDRCTYFFYK